MHTYPASWTVQIPVLSRPSPGWSWSGPVQTPGKRQNRKWLFTKEMAGKTGVSKQPSLQCSLGTLEQAWHLPHLKITIFVEKVCIFLAVYTCIFRLLYFGICTQAPTPRLLVLWPPRWPKVLKTGQHETLWSKNNAVTLKYKCTVRDSEQS